MKNKKIKNNGFLLIASLIFIVIFGALAAALVSISTANVRIPSNQHDGNKALANAMSGLEVMRNVLTAGTDIKWPDRIQGVKPKLQGKLDSLGIAANITTIDSVTLGISQINLDSTGIQSFTTELKLITGEPNDILSVTITGKNGDTERKVCVNYEFQDGGHSVFDYGVATKGTLSAGGTIEGTSTDTNELRVQAGVYIEGISVNEGLSFIAKNKAVIDGDVKISSVADGNTCDIFDIGNATIGGEQNDSRVFTNVDVLDFPELYPEEFEQYTTNEITTSQPLVENAVIKAGSNITFSNTIINGILYVKSPNVINFSGTTVINGIIVCEGDEYNPVSGDLLKFTGNVIQDPTASTLPDEIKKVGLLAPGFTVEFRGNGNEVDGSIIATKVDISGNAGGIFNGSIVSYSKDAMELWGSSQLTFNRTGTDAAPTFGIGVFSQLRFIPESYTELSDR